MGTWTKFGSLLAASMTELEMRTTLRYYKVTSGRIDYYGSTRVPTFAHKQLVVKTLENSALAMTRASF